MIQSEKFKGLIEWLKTSNEVMQKQLNLNQRTIELLGQLITEPESIKPINIKPEDMVSGEWYIMSRNDNSYFWLFKFKKYKNGLNPINYYIMTNSSKDIVHDNEMYYPEKYESIRKATREEVFKYFPNEFEIPTHGGNDVPNIINYTDEQL